MATDLEYALMAGGSYLSNVSGHNQFPVPQGWTEFNHRTSSSGFEAIGFHNGNEIVISFAGTNPFTAGDDITDLELAAGLWSGQLEDAASYYLNLKADNPNAHFTFVGHSLGGGLASLMAVFFNEDAMTFDQAPFRNAATVAIAQKLATYLADKFPAELWLNPLYQFIYGDTTLATRETKVSHIEVQGEFLSSGYVLAAVERIGSMKNFLTHGTPDASGMDLHSQTLLSAFLASKDFQDVTFKLPDVIRMIFDSELYKFDTASDQEDFMARLIRHEFGNAAGVAEPDEMLTRFTNDIWKLAQDGGLTMADFDGSNNVSKTLIAFAMQMYYEDTANANATDVDKELFTEITGGVQFDRVDVAATLYETKGYGLYFKNFLANTYTTEERDIIEALLPKLRNWYVQAGTDGLNAHDETNNGAFMLGGSNGDTLVGGNITDLLLGNLGNDSLNGGAGNDVLYGGTGNDTYLLQTTGGIDTILDHSGNDQIQIAGTVVSGEFKPAVDGGKVYYSADKLYEWRPMLDATATIWRLSVRDAGTGEYQAVADIDGWHQGKFGITTSTMAPPLPLGQERVVLSYLNSVAYLNMNGAAATRGVQFDGGTKSDSFTGSNYSDVITTGDGLSNFVLSTYGGDDSVQGGDSRDYIRTGSNGASITVSDNDYAEGGAQSDVLLGGYGSDQLWGDADDGIWLVEGADSGERGDWLNGENGNDSLYGSRSSDVAFGGAGEDLLRGGAGDDLLLGDARYASYSRATALPYAVTVTQSFRWNTAIATMAPVPSGSYALDPVMVASGNAFSWLWSVASDDYTLTTPAGFVSEKRLDQGGGGDILDGGLGNDWLAGQTGDDYLEGGDGNDMLYGDDKDGLMTATDQGDDVLLGGAGADRLYGGNGDDLLGGGPGDDTVYGGAGQDIIYFNQGDGHDTVFDPDPEPNTTLIFGKGISRDNITLHLGSLLLDLGNGDEIHIEGFDPNDVFNSAHAYLFGFADGTALTLASLLARGFDLNGAATDDSLTGTNTVDRIQGLAGNDTLQGGAGDDRLDGGIGSDTFLFSRGDGQDEITDGKQASADIEVIQFTNVASTDVSFSRPQDTDDLRLAYGSGDHVVVDGFFGADTTDGMAHFLFSDGVALTRYADIVALLPTAGNTAPALTGAPALLADGAEDTTRMIAAADLLQGYSDADGDILSVDSLTASNGTLADNLDGSWTFSPSANYHGPIALSYNVIDGNSGSVAASQNFNLAAVNDAPDGIATAVLVSGLEDTGYTINAADLLQGFSDVDGDTLSVAGLSADSGSLVDQNNGAWTYTPTADFNGVVALRYDVVDGNGGSVAAAVDLIVNPVNDLPVVRDIAATVGEDGPAVNLAADYSDVDSGDQHTVTIDTTATQGQVIHDNGHFSYDPSGRFESLPQGVTATDTFLYSVDDGYGEVTKTATITLLGVNDVAVIGGVDVWDLTETDELLATGGTLTISDPDNGEAGFRTQTEIAGSQGHGVFGIDADGKWTYTTHTAHDAFVDGQVYTDRWVVKSTDGAEHTLTVNITGTNDAAKITGASTVDLIETDAPLTSGGQLMATDVDSPAGFVAQTGAIGSGGYGKFGIDEAGTWAYVMDNAHDEFKASQTYTDAITVTTADGTPQVLAIRIQGSNDAPVTPDINDASTIENTTTILPLIPARVTDAENDPIAVTGLLGFTWNGSLTVTNPVTKAGVELSALTPSIATDGASIRFTAPAEFDWMTAGQTITCSFDYTVQETATPASRSIGKITLIINGQTNAGTGLNWTGSHGADNKTGTPYEDSLQGLNGNDQLAGEDRTDALYGGNGNDSLDGGNGVDYVYGNNGNDSLLGGADGDFLYAGNGDDAVNGGNGNDAMVGDQGNDTLVGDLGNDSLYGGLGDDQLNGGDGNDSLAGGAGDDQLVGGAGQDSFVFGKGGAEDQILDFSIADGDLIQISRDTGITHFAQLLKGMEAEQGGIEIKLGEGGEVFLVGVAAAELSTEQFVFA